MPIIISKKTNHNKSQYSTRLTESPPSKAITRLTQV